MIVVVIGGRSDQIRSKHLEECALYARKEKSADVNSHHYLACAAMNVVNALLARAPRAAVTAMANSSTLLRSDLRAGERLNK